MPQRISLLLARRFTRCDAAACPEFGVDRKWLAERELTRLTPNRHRAWRRSLFAWATVLHWARSPAIGASVDRCAFASLFNVLFSLYKP